MCTANKKVVTDYTPTVVLNFLIVTYSDMFESDDDLMYCEERRHFPLVLVNIFFYVE